MEEYAAVKRQLQQCKQEVLELRGTLAEAEVGKTPNSVIDNLIREKEEKLYGLNKKYSALSSKYRILKQFERLSELNDAELLNWFQQLRSLVPPNLRDEIFANRVAAQHATAQAAAQAALLEDLEWQVNQAKQCCERRDEELKSQEILRREIRQLKRQLKAAKASANDEREKYSQRETERDAEMRDLNHRMRLDKTEYENACTKMEKELKDLKLGRSERDSNVEEPAEQEFTKAMSRLVHSRLTDLFPDQQFYDCKEYSHCCRGKTYAATNDHIEGQKSEFAELQAKIENARKRHEEQNARLGTEAEMFLKSKKTLDEDSAKLAEDTRFYTAKRAQLDEAQRDLKRDELFLQTAKQDFLKRGAAYKTLIDLQDEVNEFKEKLVDHEQLVLDYNDALQRIRIHEESLWNTPIKDLKDRAVAYHKQVHEKSVEIVQLKAENEQLRKTGYAEFERLRELAAGTKSVRFETDEAFRRREPLLKAWAERTRGRLLNVALSLTKVYGPGTGAAVMNVALEVDQKIEVTQSDITRLTQHIEELIKSSLLTKETLGSQLQFHRDPRPPRGSQPNPPRYNQT